MRPIAAAAAAVVALLAIAAHSRTPVPRPSGELLYGQCVACHALESGVNTPAGPTLHRVVGRRIAGVSEFNYSPALRRLAARHRRWTPRLLDRFLADPAHFAPGTEMGYVGMRDPGERRALIAWLRRRR